MKTPRLAVGLVHHPVLDKLKNEVATNVLNLDVHDIARACRTFGVEKYFIIHPAQEQLMFVSRILDHWRVGRGKRWNQKRGMALDNVETATSIAEAARKWAPETKLIATSGRDLGVEKVGFSGMREKLAQGEPHLLLFGTGYGLTEEALTRCDYILDPIASCAPDGFNHLSVRSAVSICLDRLLSS